MGRLLARHRHALTMRRALLLAPLLTACLEADPRHGQGDASTTSGGDGAQTTSGVTAATSDATDTSGTSDDGTSDDGTSDDGTSDAGDSSTGSPGCEGCDPLLELCEDDACVCRPGTERCAGQCVDVTTDSEHCGACETPCGEDVCRGGGCTSNCGGGMETCDGSCTPTATDPLNCGSCGTICPTDQLCADGGCVPYTDAGCDACNCAECPDTTCCWSNFLSTAVCLDVMMCP